MPRYIGLELLIYIVLYYTLQLVYRLSTIGESEVLILMIFLIRLPSLIIKNVRGLLDEDQRQQFADIVTYFKENLTPLARDLAFLLGFYVKVLTDAKTVFLPSVRLSWGDGGGSSEHYPGLIPWPCS